MMAGRLPAVLLSWVILQGTTLGINSDPEGIRMGSKAIGDFGLTMYSELNAASDGDNIFFSPFSISTALAMTYAGARGNTRTQMRDILKFSDLGSDMEIHSKFRDLQEALSSPTTNYTLDLANRLFGQDGFSFLHEFLNTIQQNYGAPLEELDFVAQPESERQYINRWVEGQTKGKINDLLPPSSITPSTVLVLVNAIYFKGFWEIPFNPNVTRPGLFYATESNTVPVDMMHLLESSLKYHEHADWDCKMLELPYDGNRASMLILLPNERDGVSRIEERLSIDALTSAIDNLAPEMVQVSLPKFKVKQGFNLKSFLWRLGITDLFSPQADLSGMNGEQNLAVDEVVHKAFVVVNEEGTEAAAATGVIVNRFAVNPNQKSFLADRPFLFFIRDTETGTILFMGKMASPPRADGSGEIRMLGRFGAEPDDEQSDDSGAGAVSVCVLSVLWALLSYAVFRT